MDYLNIHGIALAAAERKEFKMSKKNEQSSYILDSDQETNRLEIQARLAHVEDHLVHLPLTPGSCVLDAGCGSGAIAREISKVVPSGHVFGVDNNEKYLSFAQQIAVKERITNLKFVSGNIMDLPFPDNTFDIVWSKYVLRFIKNPVRAMAEFRRVTCRGGYVVVCDNDSWALNNYPPDPELQKDLEYVLLKVVASHSDTLMGRKLFSIAQELGLRDIHVAIEPDKLYTIAGRIDAGRRANIEAQYQIGRPIAINAFGSSERADMFFKQSLAYLDREDTFTFTPLFFVKGRVP